MRHLPALLLASLLALLTVAAPAPAALNSWTASSGLGSQWTRAFEDHNGTLYAGTESDGVFQSSNGGVTFSPVSGGLTAAGALSVRALESIDGTLFAGTSAGLFKLTGTSWQPVGQAPDTAVGKRLDKAPQTLLKTGGAILAGVASGGVYRSTDGGATWTRPAYGNGMSGSETVWGLTAHPVTANLVLAATGSGMYRSTDGGATWTPKADGMPWGATTLRVVVHQAAPNLYYASTTEGVYRSIDAGESWFPINTGLTNDDVRGVFLQSPNRLYAATGNGVFASDVIDLEDPFAVDWVHITNTGLGNSIFWALGDGFFGANTLLGGTQGGAHHLTLAPPGNTSAPTISTPGGTWRAGQVATATVGAWSGTPAFKYRFQWYLCPSGANCTPIEDETDQDYVLRTGDVNDKVRVRVTARNAAPYATAPGADSAMSPFVVTNPNSLPASAAPTITSPSFPEPGNTLTSSAGSWSNNGTTVEYQWLRCDFDNQSDCAPARPASASSSYLLTESDVGFRIRVYLIGANSAGRGASPLSGSTNLIFPPTPQNLELPVIVGDAYVGDTLVGTAGTWASPTTKFARRWMRCNAQGQSCEYLQEFGSTYLVKAADLGYTFVLEVSGDPNGPNQHPAAVKVYSAPSGVIGTRPPDPVDSGGGSGGGGGGAGGGGGGTPPDVTAPVISLLKASARSFRRGRSATFNISVSEAGSLTVVFERLSAGRRKGTRCVKPTRALRRKRKCTLATRVGKPVVRAVPAGASKLSFATSKKLKPGAYRAVVVVRDAAGNVGAQKSAGYTIKR